MRSEIEKVSSEITYVMDLSSTPLKSDSPSARTKVWFLVLEKSSTTGDAYRRVDIRCWETRTNLSSEGDKFGCCNEDWRITTIKLI
jgi:hypothetical protein